MLNRREFMKLAATLAAVFGIENLPGTVSAALKKLDPGSIPRLIYLQGQSCTGCSISLLQAQSPSPPDLITAYSQLIFHTDLSAISGRKAQELIDSCISGKRGAYFLAVEGAVPEAMPEACMIGNRTFADYLMAASRTMTGAVAIGTCACHGGIPAAQGNATGAVGLREFYEKRNVGKPVINIPGCPVHPDWVWHTIVHMVRVGMPELNQTMSPTLFFDRKVHEKCPRYHDFQQEIFAEKPGDRGCLFKIGCLGPNTFADCPTRWWNGGQTWCVDANAPCIGCASPLFARNKNFPFYRLE